MIKVALVESYNVVRVTPQTESAVPATFNTWTEAMAYCKSKKYVVSNETDAERRCQEEMEAREGNRMEHTGGRVEAFDPEQQGGEGSDA